MTSWKIAAVQMDCRLGEKASNLRGVRERLREASGAGCQLVVFPECILTGYSFTSKDEAWPHAESVPGPSTNALAEDCEELGIHAIVGMLERDGSRLFNAAALVGPRGLIATYRKLHLPYLGVDRFTNPGDRPLAIHDVGGLRVGMIICYDGSFPESARVLALLGADVVVLPTNWPEGARTTCECLVRARALENHMYYAAVNRVGEERGFRFIGQSQIVAPDATVLARAGEDKEEILFAEIDPAWARDKHIVKIPGEHEVNRMADRRAEMYEVICR